MVLLGRVTEAGGDRIVIGAQVPARTFQQGHRGWIGHVEDSLEPADGSSRTAVRELMRARMPGMLATQRGPLNAPVKCCAAITGGALEQLADEVTETCSA